MQTPYTISKIDIIQYMDVIDHLKDVNILLDSYRLGLRLMPARLALEML